MRAIKELIDYFISRGTFTDDEIQRMMDLGYLSKNQEDDDHNINIDSSNDNLNPEVIHDDGQDIEEIHIKTSDSDIISEDEEIELFPDLKQEKVRQQQKDIKKLSSLSNSIKILKERIDLPLKKAGEELSDEYTFEKALEGIYAPPWEMALQKWIDAVEPGPRSFYRPSSRDAGYSDVILPGRKREGWILHIILDTSGSMTGEFPFILGKIASFCQSSCVSMVHIIQSDMQVTYNENIEVEQLYNFKIMGYGGSDMSEAMQSLSDDPEVRAAIVITDGDIDYPDDPVPYNILWVITDENPSFNPSYGSVIKVN